MIDRYSIGVDLGGTNLRVAAYGGGHDFFETIVVPTRLPAGRDQVVQDMCEAVTALISRDYGGRKLAGIAVGTPGPLELPAGTLRNPPNLPGWDGFNLKAAIRTNLGREIVLESDANLAALAEQRLGAGCRYGVANLCVITLGTGVGSGLVINGRIWDGANGMAGETGHVVVKDDEILRCGCGGHGCLEQYASGTAVMRMAREYRGDAAPSTAYDVAELARSGSEWACSIFDRVGRALAVALTGLVNMLNLPLYLLGGGLCEAWDLFSPPMLQELEWRSYVYQLTRPSMLQPALLDARKTYILKAELGPSAGLLGACVLGLEASTLIGAPRKELIAN